MRFAWDPLKSRVNYLKRGFNFEFATLIFGGPTLEREDARREYGERRMKAIGIADGFHVTVGYTDRVIETDALERRIISARRSNRGERKAYDQTYKR